MVSSFKAVFSLLLWSMMLVFATPAPAGLKRAGPKKRREYSQQTSHGQHNHIRSIASGRRQVAECYFIRGVPKSGTTWLTALLEECRKRSCFDKIEHMKSPTCKHGACPNAAESKHNMDLSNAAYWMRAGKAIFIFRDSRDVLVSHYHWARHGHSTIESFARDPHFGIEHVIKEQNKSMAAMALFSHNAQVVHYEELKTNTSFVTTFLTAFIGMRLSHEGIQAAINASSFDSMRKQEEIGNMKLTVHPQSSETLKAALEAGQDAGQLFGVMTRKGAVGGFHEELDSGTIAFVEEAMRRQLDQRLLEQYLPD